MKIAIATISFMNHITVQNVHVQYTCPEQKIRLRNRMFSSLNTAAKFVLQEFATVNKF